MPVVKEGTVGGMAVRVEMQLKVERVFCSVEGSKRLSELLLEWLEDRYQMSYDTNQQDFSTSNLEVVK